MLTREASEVMKELELEIHTYMDHSNSFSEAISMETIFSVRSRVTSVLKCVPRCMLTTLHKSYICFLLQHGQYKSVSTEFDYPISMIQESVLDSDIMLFFYYLGLSQIKTGRFAAARSSMLAVLAIPSTCYSVISLAALRKLCLLDLIEKSKLDPLPDWIDRRNSVLSRIWEEMRKSSSRQVSQDESIPDTYDETNLSFTLYTALVRAFTSSDDPRHLCSIIDSHQEYLRAAKDLGLASKVLLAKYSQLLTQVSLVYSSIEISEMFRKMYLQTVNGLEEIISFSNAKSDLVARIEGDYLVFEPHVTLRSAPVIPHIVENIRSLQTYTHTELQNVLRSRLSI
jgi:hypothetical protein